MTKVLACTCANTWQDGKYGKGLRVHNSTLKPPNTWRCTVCGRIH